MNLSLPRWQISTWISLLAFIMTIPPNIFLVWGWILGPQISLFIPNIVGITQFSKDADIVTVYGITSYINQGRPGYDDIIINEMVSFQIGSKIYTMPALFFVKFVPNNKDPVEGNFAPFLVRGGGETQTHEVMFSPSDIVCSDNKCEADNSELTWSEFKDFIEKTSETDLIITFSAELLREGRIEKSCRIEVDSIKNKFSSNRAWMEVPCWPLEKYGSYTQISMKLKSPLIV